MQFIRGNLLDVSFGILTHGCNAQGVMGAGFALHLRQKHPKAFFEYRAVHERRGLRVGEVIFSRIPASSLIIANAITQEFYGREKGRVYVSYDGIRQAFSSIRQVALENSLPVFYPTIGANLGGGEWPRISSIIDEELSDVRHALFILPGTQPPELSMKEANLSDYAQSYSVDDSAIKDKTQSPSRTPALRRKQ